MQKKPSRLVFYLILAFQLVVLSSIVGMYYAVSAFGKEVQIQTVPVDPRDAIYGDYVLLKYQMSTIDSSKWIGANPPIQHQKVNVLLRKSGDVYQAVAISPTSISTKSANEALLEGRIKGIVNNQIEVTYGIERYYVQEGTGVEWENMKSDAIATIRVAPWGQSQLVRLDAR